MTAWLTVIGIGDGGLATLAPEARQALDRAAIVFGGARHLAMLAPGAQERIAWRSPFAAALGDVEGRRGQAVAVLATGDPSWFGVATALRERFCAGEMRVLPGLSAFQLAAARLGWALESAECLSVHGRPLAALHPFVQPGARLLVLSEGGETPAALARLLDGRFYGASRLTVLEHLGGARERIREARASRFDLGAVRPLNMVAVDCRAAPDAPRLPAVAGLPDDAFRHDGKMTKRVARALAIAALAPGPGQCLWDVGAGCGSVSVEWTRAARGAFAVAIEPVAARRAMIAENAEALGAPGLAILAGRAPDAFAGLPAPDAIFIGGGLSDGVFEPAWERLAPGGRMVAHAVTLESEALLLALHARLGGELMRLQIDRAEPVGPFRGWRPAMPVTHWHATKPAGPAGPAP